MAIGGFREVLPYHENMVTLDRSRKDKWGLNVLTIDAELKDNELKMRKEILADGKEMLERAGVKDVYGWDGDGIMGQGIRLTEGVRRWPCGETYPPHYFTMIRQLTIWGYLTSEPGMTQALRYVETPGRYDGAYPYKPGDKAWAL